jgi:hypothetical protein
MFTAFSVDTRRSDLAEQKRLHQEQLRTRLRRLRRRVRHAASVQRERALLYRLLAGRFALDSPHHLLLRMLARSAMRRMRRLEALLQELSGTATSGYRDDGCLPGNIGMRGRLLESGRFYSSRIRNSENEIEETRKNLPPLRVFPNHEWPLRVGAYWRFTLSRERIAC